MDGTTPAVNYLLSPTSNDYYDHHSLQPIQSLGNLPYYQSDAVDCLYEHHKSDYQSSSSYVYHSSQQQQQPFGYGSSIYDIHSTQPFAQESNLLLLQNQSRLPPVYEMSSPSQTLPSTQLQTTVSLTGRILKREIEDTSTIPEKNHVYEWMKGIHQNSTTIKKRSSFLEVNSLSFSRRSNSTKTSTSLYTRPDI
jgi:hypothetical protein